jgi:N-acetyl-gamma-glutamyl-phosphate reductase
LRTDNISVYKAFEHQHLLEIRRVLALLQSTSTDALPFINFIPMRGNFARGILAAVYTDCNLSEEDAVKLYKEYYADAAFTFVSDAAIDLKQATNTNKALVHVEKHGSKLLIVSAIDNLLKGASGQAVQNMNLQFGLDERSGLHLKPNAF